MFRRECGMKRRKKALHGDIDKLHERGDNENKRKSMDVFKAVWP